MVSILLAIGYQLVVFYSILTLVCYLMTKPVLYIRYIWGAYDKFPEFFCMGTFIDSTHMKL